MPTVFPYQLEALAQYLLDTTKPLSEALDHIGLTAEGEDLVELTSRLPAFQCNGCGTWLRRHYWHWKCPHCDYENGRG